MPLAAGTRIGSFEILSALGVGGMGEVYRAHDAKLNRDVAIKVLLPSVIADPDRIARFRREAQVLASLNHPNIAHIHGIEEADGVTALVLELVEGEDLAQRLARGPLAIDEALPIAIQIAEALEAAHDFGIIHRDLKPANIKLRPDGTVKVLDFGLAKAIDPGSSTSGDAMNSPTLSLHATQAGVVLGTAAYMSPEQARGKVVDRRSDIWSFGCVLFEMLAARRAFASDDVTDTIVAVLSNEPDWDALPPSASRVRPLLARCLRKDRKQRLQAIGDGRIQIEELMSGPSNEVAPNHDPSPLRRVALAAIAGLACGALIAALVTWTTNKAAPQPEGPAWRFEIVPPTQTLSIHPADRNIAISPDGRHIVYRAGPPTQLVVRASDGLDARPLEGTADARHPFFSPNGQWIGFFDGTTLKKVSVTGGAAITICPSRIPRGASWGNDGTIVFGTQDTATGLLRVSADGGEPTVLTRPDASQGERDHFHPSLLPDGRGILFTSVQLSSVEPMHVAVLDLKSGQRKTLIRGGSQPEYVETGHLLYVVNGTLSAVRFDLARLEVQGDPMLVVDDVGELDRVSADYTVSRQGTLVRVNVAAADTPLSLVWVDRMGRETPTSAPLHIYSTPRLSPDSTRIALTIREQQNTDIHVFDLQRRTLMRLASSGSVESCPTWTPDGQRIVFTSDRDGATNLYAQAADGTGSVERLSTGVNPQCPGWVAPDGSGILGSEISPTTAGDVVWFPRKASSSKSAASAASSSSSPVERLVYSAAIDYFPEVSPNGRYVAYQSNESGREEVFVRPFPRVNDGVWRVSIDGGSKPAWAINGRELFYLDPTNALTAVPVQTSGATLVFGSPAKLFATIADRTYRPRNYDVAPDGRFLMLKPNILGDPKSAAIVVVLNWFEELKQRVPVQ